MDEDKKTFTLFGKDVGQIPCFRQSFLYGISGGIGVGLFYFLCTSKPLMSSHVGFGSTMGITLTYWFYCRYQLSRKTAELKMMQEYVEKRVLIEGTEMEKLFEAEVAQVSNIKKNA